MRGTAAWVKRFLTVSLTLVALALISGGYVYYRWEAQRIQTEKYGEIAAIAKMKVDQILRWRHERISDARRLAESPTSRASVVDWLRDPNQTAVRDDLRGHLVLEKDASGYVDVFLVDPDARLLLSARAAPGPLGESVRQTVTMAIKNPGPVMGDLYRADSGPIRIDTAEAVRDPSGRVVAVIILSSAAVDFLYPMIQSWPTPSGSAETLLARRDGDDILYLNELRHRSNTALVMRRPLTAAGLPAVRAALGQTGRYFGGDYRGVEVLSDLRGIPGTSWIMVTKVDTAEILAEVRYRAGAISAVVSALILFVGAAAAYAYRTRQSAESHRAGAIIQRSEALLKESQRVAALGHYEFDVAAGTWTSSEGLDAIFGISAEFTRSTESWMALIHPEHRAEMQSHLTDHVLTQGLRFDKEYRIVRVNDRAERWAHGLGALECGPDGRPVRMFGTIQDVTERKRLEEDLRKHNEDLVRFIYTVSHDLKSPLVTIRTFLGFIEEDRKLTDPTRVEKDIGFIHRAADKMTDLLDDLLELSRIGRKVNPPDDIRLQALVKGALDMVAGRIAQGHVTVTVTDAPVTLHGDRRRLIEVFENLLDNAAKFMGDQADPRVEVGIDETVPQPVLFVRDNGLGIDPRHAAKLFGLFEKLHPGTEGTGIGLALVKRIVEVHGGRIWVESAGPGQGSTFRFTLPGTRRNQAAAQQEAT